MMQERGARRKQKEEERHALCFRVTQAEAPHAPQAQAKILNLPKP